MTSFLRNQSLTTFSFVILSFAPRETISTSFSRAIFNSSRFLAVSPSACSSSPFLRSIIIEKTLPHRRYQIFTRLLNRRAFHSLSTLLLSKISCRARTFFLSLCTLTTSFKSSWRLRSLSKFISSNGVSWEPSI